MVASGGGHASSRVTARDLPAGYQGFITKPGGVDVFPRLAAASHRRGFTGELVRAGIDRLDACWAAASRERGTRLFGGGKIISNRVLRAAIFPPPIVGCLGTVVSRGYLAGDGSPRGLA